ncbi:MAG: TIM barrel protein [Clostridia bacterium]|nr:TIM barrel protein [Clostridia bacterium]
MSALFGPGGNSVTFQKQYRSTLDAPRFVRACGLDCYEYEAGQGLSASPEMLSQLGANARAEGVKLSFHTPYFISLSSTEPEKRLKSIDYLYDSARACEALGAGIMVVHTGSAAKIPRETAMAYAAETLRLADRMLEENGFSVRLGLETMGKLNQLGTLDEVLELCALSPRFAPVVDFGHMNARERGLFYTEDDYKAVFDRIAKTIGPDYADRLHCHFSKIEYTEKGEKRHLTFEDTIFGPDFEPLMDAIAHLGVSPTIISESAGTQSEDAKQMKDRYLAAVSGFRS